MPKVLRIINRFNLGGPTYNVAFLSRYLPEPYETLLVGGQKDETEDSSEFIVKQLGLKPIVIKNMKRQINIFNDYKAFKELKQIIKTYQPDIVHTHASKAGTLGRLAAFQLNVPVVVHTFHGHVFHSYFGKFTTLFYKLIERYLAKKTTAIIAISEKQKQELVEEHKIANAEKFKVIKLGFDLSRFTKNQIQKREDFRKKFHLSENTLAIGIIGRLVPVKNHILFLRAIKYVLDKTNFSVKAFIIGDGELMENLKLWATKIGLGFNLPNQNHPLKHLHFTSWIHNVDEAYAGLDIVALTSYNEGTPVSLIEAQAAQKPVISTKVGGIENIVAHQKTGFLVDLANENDFFEKLLLLVNNKQLREEMGKTGKNEIYEKFSYQRLVSDVEKLYNQLLDN